MNSDCKFTITNASCACDILSDAEGSKDEHFGFDSPGGVNYVSPICYNAHMGGALKLHARSSKKEDTTSAVYLYEPTINGRRFLMKLAGWILSGLVVLFLVGASATPKLLGLDAAIDAMVEIGWSPDYLLLLGVLEVVLTILFVVPRTGLLGAILLTGLFGGAMASHLRVGNPVFSHTLFPLYLGVFVWLSLWLRDEQFRSYFFS